MENLIRFYIAHRGNQFGPDPEKENHPDYIQEALKAGYNVEIDVWWENNKFLLGHDEPKYEIEDSFLANKKFWCHAKNIEALVAMLDSDHFIHCFWHQNDDVTLTNKTHIITYPGKLLVLGSIAMVPERAKDKWSIEYMINSGCIGICSDHIEEYKNLVEQYQG